MKRLKVTNSKYHAFVDDEDYERCLTRKWCVTSHGSVYTSYGLVGLRTKNVSLANFILNTEKQIDHKDRDALNNRKVNFRFCNNSQNAINKSKTKRKTSSKFKGVYWHKLGKYWISSITKNGLSIYLGHFESEIEAAITYDDKALELFGEFTVLNCQIYGA